jgi:predicted ATPase
MKSNPYYIITGAPSTGKTSILNELASKGFKCHSEIARQVIRENLDSGLEIFPWNQMQLFSDMVLDRMKTLVTSFEPDQIQFLDRSMVDLIGYMHFAGKEAPNHYKDEALKVGYAKKVFYLPIWEDIYTTDEERKESVEEAMQIASALYNAYANLGFEIIEVPRGSVEERVDFILESCGSLSEVE